MYNTPMKVEYTYKTHPTELVLAATIAADRVNGGEYVKQGSFSQLTTNRTLVVQFLTKPETITEADREIVAKMRQFFHGLTFKFLMNDGLGDFEKKMMLLASEDEISERDLNVVAYMPTYFRKETEKLTADGRLADSAKEYLATIGDKVAGEIEVIKMFYSEKYSCYFINGLTNENLRIRFAYSGKHEFRVSEKYSIRATVKRHDEMYTTVLGRVKVVEIDNKSE